MNKDSVQILEDLGQQIFRVKFLIYDDILVHRVLCKDIVEKDKKYKFYFRLNDICKHYNK